MKTDAEVTPYNNFDPEDQTGSTKEGRGALPDWLAYGYITPNFTRSVSRTVEYALNDFSLSQVAKGIAPNEVQTYLNRSACVTLYKINGIITNMKQRLATYLAAQPD